MKSVLHRANSRGHAQHGWLNSHHTFSFAQYYHPERMGFGALRVINDDQVVGGAGFPTHPHRNMEIISIPLKGDLEHKDSMGNIQVIREGDVQIMSAGTGVTHSEYNHNADKEVNFLQIWVLPEKENIQPRYGQHHFPKSERHNQLQQVISEKTNDGNALWINQDARFYLGQLDAGRSLEHRLKSSEYGIYLLVLSGELEAADETLKTRDGLGLWELKKLKLKARENTEFLLMEVPMFEG